MELQPSPLYIVLARGLFVLTPSPHQKLPRKRCAAALQHHCAHPTAALASNQQPQNVSWNPGATRRTPFATSGAQLAIQSAGAGLAAGILHSLCGPDHLAALTPLTIGRTRAAASTLGALWGFGHSTGQLILGMVFVLLKVWLAAMPCEF